MLYASESFRPKPQVPGKWFTFWYGVREASVYGVARLAHNTLKSVLEFVCRIPAASNAFKTTLNATAHGPILYKHIRLRLFFWIYTCYKVIDDLSSKLCQLASLHYLQCVCKSELLRRFLL